ncbi:MAG TPA: pentapeptide repeat-containing protein, partial [Pyrinomonadaceae bacterium]
MSSVSSLKKQDLLITLLLVSLGGGIYYLQRSYELWRLEILLVGGFLILSVLMWRILTYYLQPPDKTPAKDFIDVNAKILGAVALVISLLFTWQGIRQSQVSAAFTQRLTYMTWRDGRRREMADRFGKALEQLSSDKLQARVGAIYSLGQVAEESLKMQRMLDAARADTPGAASEYESEGVDVNFEDYYEKTVQTLTAYVRAVSPTRKPPTPAPATFPADLQAVFDVLGRRSKRYSDAPAEKDKRLELRDTDLRGLVLKGDAHLEGARLEGCDLSGDSTNLRGIHLENALLGGADLSGAHLDGANLEGADLSGTILRGTILSGATFNP